MNQISRTDDTKIHRPDVEPSKDQAISLLDMLSVLVTHRKLIFFATLIGAVAILLYAMSGKVLPTGHQWNLTPDVYTASMTIQLDKASGKTSLPQAAQPVSSIIALMPGGGGATALSSDLQLLKEILYSNRVLDAIIDKNDLISKWSPDAEGNPLPELRKGLKGSIQLKFSENVGSQVFYITNSSTDPRFAAQLVDSVIPVLEERFKGLTLYSVRRKKAFIDDQLAKISEDIESAKNNLLAFQRKYGSIDINAQAREQTNLIARMRADIIANELEIQTLSEYLPIKDPKVVRLQNDNKKKEQLITELKTGLKGSSGGFIPQNDIPEISLQMKVLQRELNVVEDIYALLRQEYERVKLEENDNAKIFQVIQEVEIPERKSGPSRGKMCVLFTAVIFGIVVLLSFIIEYFKNQKLDPAELAKLEKIKDQFRRKKQLEQP